MDCLYDGSSLVKRRHLNEAINQVSKPFFHCNVCGRDFDENKNIIDKDGNFLNDKGEPIGETTP